MFSCPVCVMEAPLRLLSAFFAPQTQEVQKAMDEKKFEEAVKLRGRYDRVFPKQNTVLG